MAVLLLAAAPASAQQLPLINVTPSSGTFYLNEMVNVTITFCSPTGGGLYDGPPGITFNGSQGFQYMSGSQSGCDDYGTATGTVQITESGNNYLVATIVNAVGQGNGGATYSGGGSPPPPPPPAPPIVSPKGEPYDAQSMEGATYRFRVSNPDTANGTIQLAYTCYGGLVTSCSGPSSVNIGAGQTADVVATFNFTGYIEVGVQPRVKLVASNGSSSDSGWINVGLARSDPVIARDQCLAIAVGSQARYECGDLRVVHALPAVRTFGRTRAPTLSYVSAHTTPWPIARTTLTFGSVRPDSVIAWLTVGNLPAVRRAWPKSQFPANSTRNIGVGVRADSLQTGIYSYTLEVHKKYNSGADTIMVTDTGSVAIVNRIGSPFGIGWWLVGFEQLLLNDALGPVWVGGDGSLRRYRSIGNNAYTATPVDRPDTLVFRALTSEYIRVVSGDSVVFNSQGFHLRTVNRLGHRTEFFVNGTSELLDSIRVAPASASLTYRFSYTAGPPPRLSSVVAPDTVGGAGRTVTVTRSSGRITVIKGPGVDSVRFGYNGSPNNNRLTSRLNELGVRVKYDYDGTSRLNEAFLEPESGDTIFRNFTNWESRGVFGTASAIDTALLNTVYNGPRSTSDSDLTRFWPHRFGGVRKVEDPYHYVTTITRSDPRWPALPTRTRSPNGRVALAHYDARGNVTAAVDSNPYGASANLTTRYEWNQRYDVVTRSTLPNGQFAQFGIDSTNGTTVWAEDGRGGASRVTIRYWLNGDGLGLVRAMVQPGGARDSMAYDAQGNVDTSLSPVGDLSLMTSDRLGRPRVVRTRIGSLYRTDSTLYDPYNRVLRTVAVGPAMNGIDTQRVFVQNAYDQAGRLTSVLRSQSPNPTGLDTLSLNFIYDNADRAIVAIASDGYRDSTWFDYAGNVDSVRTRRGHRIRMTYDRMNRLRRRVTPSVTYPERTSPGKIQADVTFFNDSQGTHRPYPWFSNAAGGGLQLPAVTDSFAFDSVGNLVLAINGDARVRRTFFGNGALATDSLWIRNYGDTVFGHAYGIHHTYDVNGREVRLRHPAQLAAGTPDSSVRYLYSDTTGVLTSMITLLGNSVAFQYNARNELIRRTWPGSIADSLAYDVAGRLVYDRVRQWGSSTYKAPGDTLRRDSLFYIDPVRLSWVRDRYGLLDSTIFTYSGLGHLVNMAHVRGANSAWGQPNRIVNNETSLFDPLGNAHVRATTAGQSGSGQGMGHHWASTTWTSGQTTFEPATGRIDSTQDFSSRYGFEYDSSGNTVMNYQVTTGSNSLSDRVSYYGADGLLRAAEFRDVWNPNGTWNPARWTLSFEEYRYDALGRRILVMNRKRCWVNTGGISDSLGHSRCNMSTLRRTVWDGARELWEIQMPAHQSDSDSLRENDTQPVYYWTDYAYDVEVTALSWTDMNPQFGRVAYGYAGEIDQPTAITRFGLVSHRVGDQSHTSYSPSELFPHWNHRGLATFGAFQDGGVLRCADSTHCIGVEWAGPGFMFAASSAQWTVQQAIENINFGWFGTLVGGKTDGTNTQYRRNRYLDPTSGRFTQEDPIGLAGGLNLYGFANADPISFADPFGLSPECEPPDSPKCRRERVEGPVTSTDPGFADPSLLLGVAGAVKAVVGRAAIRGGTQAIAREGAETIVSNATKAEARQAVGGLSLPDAQARAVRSAISRATTRETVDVLAQSGGNMMVNLSRPGRNGFQLIQSVISPNGSKNVTQWGVESTGRFLAELKAVSF